MRTYYPQFDAEKARLALEKLIKEGKPFVLGKERKQRSTKQNSYLHLLLGIVAAHTGYTIEWVKQYYYKSHCNPDLFIYRTTDDYVGEVVYMRSSADLSNSEMQLSINRFRNWVASDIGLYLPEPNNKEVINEAKAIIEQHKSYI